MGKTTILVIDDEQRFLDIITNTLKASNYKVIQALNGEMGCMVARKFIPDIIICDWEMPVMNGIDAIKILKQDDLTKDIPIIMATGVMTTAENLNMALSAGAIDYIRKPIVPIELLARLNSAYKLASSYAEIKVKNDKIMEQFNELKLLNATRDKFYAIISHDLRSPFNGILGLTDLLVENYGDYDDSERKEIIFLLRESSYSAFELLENLLSWSQIQRGQIKINKENLNLKELVETSIAPYKYNSSKKNIEIITNIPPLTKIFIDKNTSMTFIGNLVNNAIKFTPEGGTITISYNENDANIELHIIDTGVGMTSEVIGRLFRIDENISTNGTNNEKGTGLGLILCKEFIQKNGGDISVISEVGKGSDFIVTLSK
ncbi:hybrid sensor histidine kinase/response regulator [uncultured Maribacter sp.]|uniref:hybrid sensor histidine kinase/response regulator n=1 Tax=uncultured Maribacter sp. TaxID=431308 RepID=UPI0030EB68A4|tara:strand:+ start:3756 stop:4880 length:1125 start_codon:yes stop_codon:yes gene_type:complete